MNQLEIVIKITKYKGIQIGQEVSLFGKPRKVVGFFNDRIVLVIENPQTMLEAQVKICSVFELAEFYKRGLLLKLVDLK